MALVTLQLGQCGNQVGGQIFSTLMDDIHAKCTGLNPKDNQTYTQASLETFFNEPDTSSAEVSLPQARAVLVDMESKAITNTIHRARKTGKWTYSPKSSFHQKRGSGNNWAHGFCVHGPRSQYDIMNLIRKECEKCDRLGGFVNLMSLAGGTGSGVGAFITESLRDQYPHSFIMNQVVWPFTTGEVIVQNYNALLTLSRLYDTADAIVVMENDSLQKICSQLLAIKNISFEDINRVIAHKLTSVLQPSVVDGTGAACDLGTMLQHLVGHPQHKLLTIKNIPQVSDNARDFSFHQWPGLVKNLRQMMIADAPMEEGINWDVKASRTASGHTCFNRSLASMLILRGKDVDSVDTSLFQDSNIYTSWMPPGFSSCVSRQPRLFCDYEKSAALLSNSCSSVKPLNRIIDKAWTMFSTRAYVHQYLKHGMTEEDFLDSFVSLEKVVASYNNL